eukprot:TRINITY_DN699_c0_g1_i7.p1 TRINITY_DN699_c0_g1~~TRINITY_DN699_c0_g1_i7.p1  ORF type:complete len:539 (-),score=209.79 TRINITY_DN699_c0_g1_i7:16-1632(-)
MNNGYFAKFFNEIKKLGSGGFGGVWLCKHILNGIELGKFAIKKVPIGSQRSWFLKVLREVHVLNNLQHPNIVAYKHAWLEVSQPADFGPTVPCLFILMEYANSGNLADLIIQAAKRKKFLPDNLVWQYFLDTCLGLNYLHQVGVIHEDLKPQNLLLHTTADRETGQSRSRILISDFGQSELLESTGAIPTRTRCGATGTVEYMAPELLERKESGIFTYSPSIQSDIWSLGLILYYLAYSKSMFETDSPELSAQKVLSFKRVNFTLNPKRPKELQEFIELMLIRDANARPTTITLLRNPILQNFLNEFNINTTENELNNDNLNQPTSPLLQIASKRPNYKMLTSSDENIQTVSPLILSNNLNITKELNENTNDDDNNNNIEKMNDGNNDTILYKRKNIKNKIEKEEKKKILRLIDSKINNGNLHETAAVRLLIDALHIALQLGACTNSGLDISVALYSYPIILLSCIPTITDNHLIAIYSAAWFWSICICLIALIIETPMNTIFWALAFHTIALLIILPFVKILENRQIKRRRTTTNFS